MSRALAVANCEFQALIRTKFFIVSIVLLPIIVGSSIAFSNYAERHVDTDPHHIAIIDETHQLMPAIIQAAAAPDPPPPATDPDATPGEQNTIRKPVNLELIPVPFDSKSLDELRVDLSSQVKAKSLYGFVDIPAGVLSPDPTDAVRIDYFTNNVTNENMARWLSKVINEEVTRRRFATAGVDQDLADRLSKTTRMVTRALVERAPDGSIQRSRVVHSWETFAVPFGLMYLMFLAIMMSAPHMMNAVIEEKMSRISEVLLASVTPTELLAGKLLGISALSILLALAYLGGGIYVALAYGESALLQFGLIPWFLVFLICAVTMFGSLFLSVGAACADLKDAQSMMQPAMFFMLIPIFMAPIVLPAPNGALSVALSFLPTAAPFIMLLRLASTPPPPLWQAVASVVLTAATAVLFVWAAGRIFRVGLLMQGKAPNLPELLKWIRA